MKINSRKIYGVNPVIAMPFKDNGKIDYLSFIHLIEHLLTTGCHGITLFGIASEFYKLSDLEKIQLAELFIQRTLNEKVYNCLSVTQHCTELAVDQAQTYQQLGADSLMLLPPFFLQPTAKQIEQHIFAVLEAVTIPVLIQYAPGETNRTIPAQIMAEISQRYPHAVFKIESNPPVEYSQQLLRLNPDCVIMNGYAGMYMLDMLSIGGKGVMPGSAFTEIYVAIYQLYQQQHYQQAKQLHQRLLKYITDWMSHCEYIIKVEKQILMLRGVIKSDYCRQPDWLLAPQQQHTVTAFITEFADYFDNISAAD